MIKKNKPMPCTCSTEVKYDCSKDRVTLGDTRLVEITLGDVTARYVSLKDFVKAEKDDKGFLKLDALKYRNVKY